MSIPLEGQLSPTHEPASMAVTEEKKSQEEAGEKGDKGPKMSFFENFFSRVSAKEKIFFVQQIGIMLQTGISLAIALKTLAIQTKNKKFKTILSDLELIVERGNLLSSGLEKYKKVFGELFVNMVKAGEQSGKLEEVLKQLFIQMKKDSEIVSRVRSAMIYPCIVITAMVGVGIMVMVYVIPNLTSIFKDVGAELPLTTKILIALSDIVIHYGLFLLAGIIVFIILFAKVTSTARGKYIFHSILLKTPIVGGIIQKINLARFCRTLSSLLKTDIAIIKSFEITANVLGNEHYKIALLKGMEDVKKGKSVHDSLEPYPNLFPPIIMQMVAVGEETGAIDVILEQSAVFYEDDVDQTMKNLPSILEPVLILVLGIGVAIMAVAIMMPMYSLSQEI